MLGKEREMETRGQATVQRSSRLIKKLKQDRHPNSVKTSGSIVVLSDNTKYSSIIKDIAFTSVKVRKQGKETALDY